MREERKQEKGGTVDGRVERERSSRVKERLVESRPGRAGGGKRAIGWRGGGGGNRGESEGDGKLCETRSSAHKPSYITESLTLYPAAPFPPHRRPPSPRDETQLLSATSTHPPRHPSASHSPLPLPFQPPPLACTVPFRSLPARHSSLYPMSESKGVLWG